MFSKNKFWKFIEWIISKVIYWKKGYKLLESRTSKDLDKAEGEIDRYVSHKKYLLKVSCYLYGFN